MVYLQLLCKSTETSFLLANEVLQENGEGKKDIQKKKNITFDS